MKLCLRDAAMMYAMAPKGWSVSKIKCFSDYNICNFVYKLPISKSIIVVQILNIPKDPFFKGENSFSLNLLAD